MCTKKKLRQSKECARKKKNLKQSRVSACGFVFSHLLPCCAWKKIFGTPAVPILCRFSLRLIPLTLLCPDFLRAYPAVPLFFFRTPAVTLNFFFCTPAVPLILFSLTLLFPYFPSHLPCHALTPLSLTLLCAYYFSSYLPCCRYHALRLQLSYPAVLSFFYALLLYRYAALQLPLTLLCPHYFSSHLPCCCYLALLGTITTYPAVFSFFYALLLYRYAALRLPLTLLCHYFSTHIITLLCPYPPFRLTIYLPCPYFTLHLPCYVLIFVRTYPATIGYQKTPRSKRDFLHLVLKVHSAHNKFGMYRTELGCGSLMRHF